MKDKLKKVTKTLAKEIATKFFGRAVNPVEDIGVGHLFKCGAIKIEVFPYFGGAGKDFRYPNEYPYGQVFVQGHCICDFKYVDGGIETENSLHNEYEELREALLDIQSLLEVAIDAEKINVKSDFLDRWIVKDKAKLLKIVKLANDMGDKYL